MTMLDPRNPERRDVECSSDSAGALIARWRPAVPFLFFGSLCITVGGLVAAVTRPIGFGLGPWTAAFLVLVGGVAQIALGVGQAWLAGRLPQSRRVRSEVITWNVGVSATIAGTLAGKPSLTTLGGLLLAVALGLFIATTGTLDASPRAARVLYLGIASVVLVSIPVGLSLAWLRHS